MVWPTICGKMVAARLQVLITRFSLRAFIASIFFSSLGSMNGPFFSERDILNPPLALLTTTADDKPIRPFVGAGFVASGGFAPGRFRAGHTDWRAALAAAVRVALGVHRGAAHGGPPAHPALTARLADLDVAVIEIADLAHRRHALLAHDAQFTAGQANLGILLLAPDQLRRRTRRTRQLPTPAPLQFDVVDERADGHVAQRQGVAVAERG